MTCRCGFEFAGPGEFRNCSAFIAESGRSGVICPRCGRQYVGEELVSEEDEDEKKELGL